VYDFCGLTRFDKLFAGLIEKRPAFLGTDDLAGTEDIQAEIDADYGRLLEAAYGKGVTSPSGLTPLPVVTGLVQMAA
jgi:hypothetical protein